MSRPVLHVINRLTPIAGAEKQVVELARRSAMPSRIVELQGHSDRPSQYIPRLHREIRAADPVAVVAWLDRSQIAVALVGSGGRPLIASIGGPGQRRPRRRRWYLRTALRRFDAFHANSEPLRRATREFSAAARIRPFAVIPNGIDIPNRSDDAHTHRGMGRKDPDGRGRASVDGAFRVGYVGRVNYWKGVDVLLQALRQRPATKVRATLVGSGAPELAAEHPDLRDRCVFLPHADEPWVAAGPIDVFVIPSRAGSEGSPNVVVEAFARGIPVIGTTDPPVMELLSEGRGLIVPAGDPRALAGAIIDVQRDPAGARARAERALAYVGEHHSWQGVVAAWDGFISRLGGRRSRDVSTVSGREAGPP